MRLSAILLAAALCGVVGGAWLIGLPAVGGAVIFDSLCVGAWALLRDDGKGAPRASGQPATSLHEVLDRARAS